jgi:DNA-binding response OmpR family regulator
MKGNELLQAGEPAGASVQCLTNFSHRILVVDDDSDLHLLYAEALARPGYRVDAAEDGAAGWEALQANNYNLLITEHSLPKLTGVELVRKLRSAHMAVPVVMVAVRLPTLELVQKPPLQLAALLSKPFYISELLQTVRAVLRATGSPREQKIAPQPNRRSEPSTDDLRL